MANAVFVAGIDSPYDDLVEERYHFPKMYLSRIEKTVGDWIIYYEPRSGGGRLVYFAMARVSHIEPDRNLDGHYYARICDFSAFPDPVALRPHGKYLESSLRLPDGSINTAWSRTAVRLLPREEFDLISRLGMTPEFAVTESSNTLTLEDPPAEYGGDRPIVLASRAIRDAAFARIVHRTYDRTCAMTGLKLVNGGGRCEIEAAHIRPVEENGPDSPKNGVALCRTVHWLFDRGFLSLEDDGTILQAAKLVPDPVRRILNPDGKIRFPSDLNFAPHRHYLNWHREYRFKGS